MKCPRCEGTLDLWLWEDGKVKGLACYLCSFRVWSNKVADQVFALRQAVEQNYIETLNDMPSDADELPPWLQDNYLNGCDQEERANLFAMATEQEKAILIKRGKYERS
jgi:Zn ribbon nucleic-acid-binding protein